VFGRPLKKGTVPYHRSLRIGPLHDRSSSCFDLLFFLAIV
jgi:hypothetical protein